jgi:hypothetical protein
MVYRRRRRRKKGKRGRKGRKEWQGEVTRAVSVSRRLEVADRIPGSDGVRLFEFKFQSESGCWLAAGGG